MEKDYILVLLPFDEVVRRLDEAWETVQGRLSRAYLKRSPVSGEHAAILEIWRAPGIISDARLMMSISLRDGDHGVLLDPWVASDSPLAEALCAEWVATFQADLPDLDSIWIYSKWLRLHGEPRETIISMTFDADIADFDCAMRDALREYERRGYVVYREAGAGFVLFRVSFQGQRLLDLEIARTSAGMLETQALAVSDVVVEQAGLLDRAREIANGTEKAIRHFQSLLEPAKAEARRLEAEVRKKGGRNQLNDEQWQKRFEQVQEVLRYASENDLSQEKACANLGVAYGTFRQWKAEMEKRKDIGSAE